eukprot:NODE_590_length_1458_cov_372.233785.p2 GENE.NODE_590_length_1458_cov_372.233785~~NODE_590_length_1458_cov_372.233785.p2  ORF type:complete len:272 (-),score=78.30 NODE_590_length_1458_cov_372.233785:625-1440(-)
MGKASYDTVPSHWLIQYLSSQFCSAETFVCQPIFTDGYCHSHLVTAGVTDPVTTYVKASLNGTTVEIEATESDTCSCPNHPGSYTVDACVMQMPSFKVVSATTFDETTCASTGSDVAQARHCPTFLLMNKMKVPAVADAAAGKSTKPSAQAVRTTFANTSNVSEAHAAHGTFTKNDAVNISSAKGEAEAAHANAASAKKASAAGEAEHASESTSAGKATAAAHTSAKQASSSTTQSTASSKSGAPQSSLASVKVAAALLAGLAVARASETP